MQDNFNFIFKKQALIKRKYTMAHIAPCKEKCIKLGTATKRN